MKRSNTRTYVEDARNADAIATEYLARMTGEVDRLERAITTAEGKREAGMRSWKTGNEPPAAVLHAGVELGALRDRLELTRSDLETATEARERAAEQLTAAELRHDLHVGADKERELWPRLVDALTEIDAVAREAEEATAGAMRRARNPHIHRYIVNVRDSTRPIGLSGLARHVHSMAAGRIIETLMHMPDMAGLLARVKKGQS